MLVVFNFYNSMCCKVISEAALCIEKSSHPGQVFTFYDVGDLHIKALIGLCRQMFYCIIYIAANLLPWGCDNAFLSFAM
jgi:hypothetical protein